MKRTCGIKRTNSHTLYQSVKRGLCVIEGGNDGRAVKVVDDNNDVGNRDNDDDDDDDEDGNYNNNNNKYNNGHQHVPLLYQIESESSEDFISEFSSSGRNGRKFHS